MLIVSVKGDQGKTCLINSSKSFAKNNIKIKAIGAIDEINSYLGIANSYCQNPETKKFIVNMQIDLFLLNSILAGNKVNFSFSKTKKLENKINKLNKTLPKLNNFVLNSGTKFAVHLQYTRALTRRAEREIFALNKQEKIKPEILKYINRLSDLLFILAREANFRAGVKEEIWK